MSRNQIILSTLLALAAGLCLSSLVNDLASGEGDPGAAARVQNVATVDMEEVIEDYMQRSGALASIQNKAQSKRRALAVIRDEIRGLEQSAGTLAPNSEEYFNVSAQLAIKREEIRYYSQVNQAQIDAEQAKLTREVYEKAMTVIEGIAREKNHDLVLMKQTGRVLGNAMNEVSSNIVVRSVLFGQDRLDITALVKQRLK